MAIDRRKPLRDVVWTETPEGEQLLPVNVFDTRHDLVVTAPMPGVEPENIEATVAGTTLTIRAGMRGPGQERRDYVHHEWTYGPYFRRLELPCPVDAEHANASYGNGVLTLTLPKLESKEAQRIMVRSVDLRLEKTGTAEGHREGHAGHREAGKTPPWRSG